jgi:hypothetical protein
VYFRALLTNSSDSFIFLFFSMVLIAASLYLPQHIAFLTNRAWFYYHGTEMHATTSIISGAKTAIPNAVPGIPEGFTYAGRMPGTAAGWNNREL